MRPRSDTCLTLVADRPLAVYSGMVPGFVAGRYNRADLEIDLRPLALRAGARVVFSPLQGVDSVGRRIEVAGRPPLPYDVASFNVGSTAAGTELPGVAGWAVATRPISRFLEKAEQLCSRFRGRDRFRLVIVGAGAGGIELAFAFRARMRREGVEKAEITLLEAAGDLLPGSSRSVSRRVVEALRARDIALRTGVRAASVHAGGITTEHGEAIEADAVIWVAGAAALPLFGSGLPVDDRGFLRVRPTLQVADRDELFAAGDCVRFEPALPKAGVYAVRQGPVLLHNLRAHLDARRMRRHRPQSDFLSLLNTGDGSAIAVKWGRSVEGRVLFWLKDWIDRRFVRRFQVLDAEGRLARAFPEMEMRGSGADGSEEMPCGGCACKVGGSLLERALGRLGTTRDERVVLGLGARDDAAAVTLPGGGVWVASVDAFRAFTRDPYLVGRVAAINAASDLWAKGVSPRFALAAVTLPRDDGESQIEETLVQVLSGARHVFDPEGVTLLGGHTDTGEDLSVGFTVWGEAPGAEQLLPLAGLVPGQRLILTKALGTGVLFYADMRGLARGEWIEDALASMLRTNRRAAGIARDCGAAACTDISGFGLAGHLVEMLRAGGVSARLELATLPLLPGAAQLLARGLRSTFHPENARGASALQVAPPLRDRPEYAALFDPQTSGGLLFGVPEQRVAPALAALREAGYSAAAAVGTVVPPGAADPPGSLCEIASGGAPASGWE